ncbi:hypothetical protein [Sphingomonas sp. G-3-2-10]|uniref:beta strand repeat-containing protein n=1 Tax=Sphingomonas sp. G-3-2-10 TaxID=2728838 RepID=UPI00146CE1D0|nr:hypothetical protein [Sphingomonas sp. G-3-2-10]NML04264.1 hypothetical protein [Sphingomonas sp. G-3-2-10]
MAKNILFEVSPLNGSTPITLRMASDSPDASGTLINGYEWSPLIIDRSARPMSLSEDGILTDFQNDYGTISFLLHTEFGNAAWAGYEWNGALGRLFVGDLGDPFSSYKQTFEGSVSDLELDSGRATLTLLGPEAALDKPLLTATYAGTGGVEGPTGMKGALKPRADGNCNCIDPVLIDSAKWIYQVHGYGPVASITPYEFGQALDNAKKKPDSASYAALAALTLLPGEWGTCLAEGLFRLGGTPAKKVSADLTFSGSQTVATALPQLLAVAGVPGAKIGSFAAFSSVGWNNYQTTQITVREIAKAALRHAGGYLVANSAGVWTCGDFFAPKTPVTVDAKGSSALAIRNVKSPKAALPIWNMSVGYNRCWNVHSASDVSPAIAEISDAAGAAKAAADAAHASADAAAATANAQKTRLDSMVSDSVLDRSEKAQVILEVQRLTAAKAGLNSQATGLGITTENTAYNSAFSTWNSYIAGLTPAYTDTTQDTPGIVRSNWNTIWGNLYTAEDALRRKIADIAATKANFTSISGLPTPIAGVTNSTVIDNSSITITGGGQLSTGAGTLSPVISNGAITVNVSTGVMNGIGTSGVVVDNSRQLFTQITDRPLTLTALDNAAGTKLATVAVGATSDIALTAHPAATTVVITGNKVSRTGGAGTYAAGTFYSKLAQTASFVLEWTPNAAGQGVIAGMGIAATQVLPDGILSNLDYSFFAGYSNGYVIRKNGSNLGISGTYTPGDIFRMAYDGGEIVFKINDTTIYTATGVAPNQSFYAIGSVTDAPGTLEGIKWSANTDRSWDNMRGATKPAPSAGTNLTLVAAGSNAATLNFPGNMVVKSGAAYYSWAFSRESYTDACTLSCSGNWNGSTFPGSTVIGLSTNHPSTFNPAGSNVYSQVLFGWLISGTGYGFWIGGGNAASWSGTATGSEQLELRYDGTQFQWVINGTVVYTYTHPAYVQPNLRMYLVCDVANQGGGAKDILFSGSTVKPKSGSTLFSSTNTTLTDGGIITNLGIAAGFTGQTDWATYTGINTSNMAGRVQFLSAGGNLDTLSRVTNRRLTLLLRDDGSTALTEAAAITSLGNAAGIAGQAATATSSDFSVITGATKPAANATKNIITTGSSAPSSPVDGDLWNDTSTNPATVKLRVSGAWVVASNLVSNTNQITDGAGLGSTAVWTSVSSRPTNLAGLDSTANTKLSGIQPNADVTANSQHQIVAANATIDFAADYQNTLLSGQISKTVAVKRFLGTTDYSSSTTWATSATSGITCSISSAGILSFTAVANGTVTVTGTYNSVAMQVAITVTRTLGAPPAGGGSGATSASTTAIGAATSSSYTTGVSNTLTVAAGSSGTIALTTTLDFYISGSTSFSQSQGCLGKWQWRAVSGSWADVGTEVASSWDAYMPSQSQYELPTFDSDSQPTSGHIDVGQSKSGLTSGTSYEFRFVWRLSGGGPTIYGSGNFYAAQS